MSLLERLEKQRVIETEEIKNIKPFKIDITIDQQKFSEEIITFLVLKQIIIHSILNIQ